MKILDVYARTKFRVSYIFPPIIFFKGLVLFLLGIIPEEKIISPYSGVVTEIRKSEILIMRISDEYFTINKNEEERINKVLSEISIGDSVYITATNEYNIIRELYKNDIMIIPYEEENILVYIGSLGMLIGLLLMPYMKISWDESVQRNERELILQSVNNSTYPKECYEDIKKIQEELQKNKNDIYVSFKIDKIGKKRLKAELKRIESLYEDTLITFFKQYNDKHDLIAKENESKTIKVGNITIVDENGMPVRFEN